MACFNGSRVQKQGWEATLGADQQGMLWALTPLLLREPQTLEEAGAQLSLKCLSLGLFCQQEALLARTCLWPVTGRL